MDNSDQSFSSSRNSILSSLKVIKGVLAEDRASLDLVNSLNSVVTRIEPASAVLIPTISWNRFADIVFDLGNSISVEQTSNADRTLSTFSPDLQTTVREGLLKLEAAAAPLALGLAFPEQSVASSTKALESLLEMNGKAEEALAQLALMVEKGHPLVRKLALNTNANAYAQHARTQTVVAALWRAMTIACLSLVGYLGWRAIDVVSATSTSAGQLTSQEWASLAAHLAVSSAVTALAVFAAKQAAWHRRHGAEAKDMVLRLSTVEPFLDEFPREERLQLLQAIAVPLFASPNLSVGPIADDGASESSATSKLIDLLISRKP